jgi:Flp pilus assembly protein TadB
MKVMVYLWSLFLSGSVFCLLMFWIESSGVIHSHGSFSGSLEESCKRIGKVAKVYLQQTRVPKWFEESVPRDLYRQSGIRIERQLYLSGWWFGLEILALSLLILWIWIDSTALFSAALIGLGVLVGLTPAGYLNFTARRRTAALRRSFPDFLDLLNMTVRAGIGFLPALQKVEGSMTGPLAEDLQKINCQITRGFTVKEALTGWAERTRIDDVERFIESVILSQRLGTSLARTIGIQADLLRANRKRKAEEQAQTAPIRIIPALVFCFLPSLMLIYLAPPILNFLLGR